MKDYTRLSDMVEVGGTHKVAMVVEDDEVIVIGYSYYEHYFLTEELEGYPNGRYLQEFENEDYTLENPVTYEVVEYEEMAEGVFGAKLLRLN